MLFNASQRKGVLVLALLIVCLIVLPKQFLQSDHKLFVINDTIPTNSISGENASKKRSISPFIPYNADLEEVQNLRSFYNKKVADYRKNLTDRIIHQKISGETKPDNDSTLHPFAPLPAFTLQDDLNQMSFKEVLQHPYLDYKDVQLIFKAKQKYRTVSFSILESHNILSADKLKKIKPYFK